MQTQLAVPEAPAGRSVAAIVEHALRPTARAIDEDGRYPREIMHELGAAGAFASLADGPGGTVAQADMQPAIEASEAVAAACAATAFCCWCQGALVWYLRNTANTSLRESLLANAAEGAVLGGTALSNPMKNASGLEKLRLRETGRSACSTIAATLRLAGASGAASWVCMAARPAQP